MRRFTLLITLAVAASLLLAAPASAGGWAVATLDGAPAQAEAGKTYTVGYTILQHGERPVDFDIGETSIQILSSGAPTTFQGTPSGEPGHFTAEVTFPEAGQWQWQVSMGTFGEQPLGTLPVVDPATATAGASDSFWASDAVRATMTVGAALMLALFIAQAAWLVRDRRQPALEPEPASSD